MKSKEYVLLKGIIFLCIVTGFYMVPSMAVGEKNYTVPGKNYVLAEDSNFDYTRAPSVDTFIMLMACLVSLHFTMIIMAGL